MAPGPMRTFAEIAAATRSATERFRGSRRHDQTGRALPRILWPGRVSHFRTRRIIRRGKLTRKASHDTRPPCLCFTRSTRISQSLSIAFQNECYAVRSRCPKLPQDTQAIVSGPEFDDLATFDAEDKHLSC